MLEPWISLWWERANERRQILIHWKHKKDVGLGPHQERELSMLQKVADALQEYETDKVQSAERAKP